MTEHKHDCCHTHNACDHNHNYDHNHDHGSDNHNNLDFQDRSDKPLIDGADDECSCACSHHPEDASSKEVVAQMVSQLDEAIALSSGPVYGEFIANESLQLRLIELLEKVQNASLSLPADFKNRKPKADWSFLETLTEQVIHPEFGRNPETLWDVVRLEIPYQHKMLGIIINGCSHEH